LYFSGGYVHPRPCEYQQHYRRTGENVINFIVVDDVVFLVCMSLWSKVKVKVVVVIAL
jgi:hypothetical protein